jgi:hypothetical protein
MSLSQRQTQQITAELGDQPAGPLEIRVAITKTTDRLPTEAQMRKIVRELESGNPRR